jgi:transposase
MREETFNMTKQEMKKLRVIDSVISRSISISEAAGLLGLSERQVFRLKKGVLEEGAAFIIHKNKGRKPAHAISDAIKKEVITLRQSDSYRDANFAHFKELLEQRECINLSYSSVHRILSDAGICSPKKKRKAKAHHRRKRKEKEGLMVQIDASPHAWFDETAYSLHGAIDDATGKILALHFEKNECLRGYFEVIEQMIWREGIPELIYCDRHTIFRSPKKEEPSIEQQLKGKQGNLTQFGQAMDELGIGLIFAKSPQAKGRIERLWETLQSRLPIEFKIHGIASIDDANRFLEGYIDKFNGQFAVMPEDGQDAYRSLEDGVDLSAVLCVKEQRVVSDGSGFSYGGRYHRIMCGAKPLGLPKGSIVTVLDCHKRGLRAMYNGTVYETNCLVEKPKKAVPQRQEAKVPRDAVRPRPADDHPWRTSRQKRPRLSYEESDRELLEALFDSSRAWA